MQLFSRKASLSDCAPIFLLWLYGAASPKRFKKIDYITKVKDILNVKGYQTIIVGSKVMVIFHQYFYLTFYTNLLTYFSPHSFSATVLAALSSSRNVLTLGKFGRLNHIKSKSNFVIPPICESPDWRNSSRAIFLPFNTHV